MGVQNAKWKKTRMKKNGSREETKQWNVVKHIVNSFHWKYNKTYIITYKSCKSMKSFHSYTFFVRYTLSSFLKANSNILCFITIKENICGLQTINTIYNKKYITSFSSWCDDKGMHKCWLKIDFPSSVCWDVCTPLYTICWIFTSYITMMFINNVWNNKYAITLF